MASETVQNFVEYPLQYTALASMATLYAIKIYQLSHLPLPRETAPAKGSATAGGLRSFAMAFLPWAMESSRRHLWRWAEFILYHLGVASALVATFLLPFAEGIMTDAVRLGFAIAIVPAAVVGVVKLVRRITWTELRMVTTLDDYFALVAMEVFYVTGVFALITNTSGWRTTYFLVTALLIFYVPFSKISHYVYFFFARLAVGRRYGHRGVMPERGAK